MKTFALFAFVSLVTAFPAAIFENSDPEVFERAVQILKARQSGADSATAVFEPLNTFNAQKQYIDVSESSGHAYKAPGEGDLRGPCPGLNAFANHNFIPHNGYATIDQFIQATEQVVGMGSTLALFLATYGAIVDGSGTAWSIGGTPGVGSAVGGNGISGSHNKYESDASPTRPDLYQAGNDYMTVGSQFQQMLAASNGGPITIDSLTEFRSQRFNTQKSTNAYFFNGPFTGVLVQPAAYTFIFRFMANHSSEYPTGYLSPAVAESWFGIVDGEPQQGQEQIPANWYRRALEYPYSSEYFLADVAAAAALHPEFLDIGGNTGTAGQFTGVDVANLTGGVYNAQSLGQGNNAACLAYQFAAQVKPDAVLGDVAALAGGALNQIISGLGCPQLEKIDDQQLSQFPGYSRSPAA